jgi:hypothetical protein
MTKEEVLEFLRANLKDGGNRVGIELTTDGDSGPTIRLYSEIIYNYSDDHERYCGQWKECDGCDGQGYFDEEQEEECGHCEGAGEIEIEVDDASDVVYVTHVSKKEVLKMIETMLG